MATLVETRISVARDLAGVLLENLPDRWQHTIGVAGRAEELAATVPAEDHDLLVAAAWLHDIGYSAALVATGLHSLDGADYLARSGWSPRLCALVAHHSGAEFVARVRQLGGELARHPHERSAVADALTYADQTVGPRGQRMTINQRLAEMLTRRGAGSPQARVHHLREPYLRGVASRVESRLANRRLAA